MSNNYYVYELISPWNNEIFYVGKGKNYRANSHKTRSLVGKHKNKDVQVIYDEAFERNVEIIVNIVENNLSEKEALNLEIELITKYGRKDLNLGPLRNRTNGGDGMWGLKVTEEFRQTMSLVTMGHPVSLDTREKIRQKILGKKHTEKTKKEMSENRKGDKHPFFGKTHSEETKAHWSKIRKGKLKTPEEKEKIRQAIKLHWQKRKENQNSPSQKVENNLLLGDVSVKTYPQVSTSENHIVE